MAATLRRIRLHVPLALFCLAIGSHLHAQVGPNGEVDGLTAKFVDVNGVRTRYYDYGKGEPVLLIHGGDPGNALTGSANTWSRNIRGLAKRFRVLALDRLAQGMTANPKQDKDWRIRADIEHTYEFMRAMKLDKAHLVGHSSGGAHLFYLAVQHPEIVKSFTAVASAAGQEALTKGIQNRLDAIVVKCPPIDALNAESLKCRAMALAYSPSPEMFPPDFLKAQHWMANLPKAVEARKRVAALRAAEPQREAEEQAYFTGLREKARNGRCWCRS
jgi:pimeloyl-ACP methyl ester carboxylesterase